VVTPSRDVMTRTLSVEKGLLSLGRPRVLIADDHDLVLERVRSLLKTSFEVIGTANNGKTLLAESERLQPDVIVLDITMPILNGIEAAHELRQTGSTVKLVFLTVHEEPEFVQACFAEGGLGYVTKSRLVTDLVPAINDALSGRHFISSNVPR
jgi:DNA-binding NarL/FixJ family response regulator